MKFWGKLIGAFCGFLLAGPLGLFLGLIIGHFFDRGLMQQWPAWPFNAGTTGKAQQAFFNATFLVMGHLAKADGRVSEAEIRAAREIMRRMGLDEEQRKRAIELFEEGKQPTFDLKDTLDQLAVACHNNKVLLRLFVELQMQTALADGQLSSAKQQILQTIAQRLGFAPLNFVFFQDFFDFQQAYQQGSQYYQYHQQQRPASSRSHLQEAYTVLGVEASASDVEIKRAYRRLMNQHHPDKLISKGLPEEMLKLATEKTQQIKAAYDTICAARGAR